jgi:hypothetical protein
MTRRDWLGLGVVAAAWAGLMAYRYAFIEPRAWGAVCAAASVPFACVPRAGLLWLQREYLLGAVPLVLGLWALFGRGGFAVQVAAVVIGVAGVENYNATWGAVGAALGVWAWARRENWGEAGQLR